MLLSRNGISLIIWITIFTILVTLVLIGRFYAIRIKRRSFRIDDWVVVFGYTNTLALTGVVGWAISNGLGAHTSEVSTYQLGVQYKLILLSGPLWLLATVSCKLSIIWLYTTIFPDQNFKYAAWTLMGFICCFGISFLPVFLTNCTPIYQSWHPIPGGHCRPLKIEEFASVAVNMLIDLLIVLLPLPSLWKLQMATKNKIFVTAMFSLGLAIVALAGWRIKITGDSLVQSDFVHGLYLVGLVSLLELWLGIIAACLPTLTPVFWVLLRLIMLRKKGHLEKCNQMGCQDHQAPKCVENRGRSHFRRFDTLDTEDYCELGGESSSLGEVEVLREMASTTRINEA